MGQEVDPDPGDDHRIKRDAAQKQKRAVEYFKTSQDSPGPYCRRCLEEIGSPHPDVQRSTARSYFAGETLL